MLPAPRSLSPDDSNEGELPRQSRCRRLIEPEAGNTKRILCLCRLAEAQSRVPGDLLPGRARSESELEVRLPSCYRWAQASREMESAPHSERSLTGALEGRNRPCEPRLSSP